MKNLACLLGLFFLILFSFVSASDYIMYKEIEEPIISYRGDSCLDYEKDQEVLGFSKEAKGCIDEKYCVVEYGDPYCETDGEWRQDIISENCEDCQFGCYNNGCLNSKVSCDNFDDCRIEEGEVMEIEDMQVAVLRFSEEPYMFLDGSKMNTNSMDNWHKLNSGRKLKDDYFIHILRSGSDYVEFSLKKEENECAEDSDCESKEIINCGDGFLQTVIKDGLCNNKQKCESKTVDIIEEICEYKCENKTCIECEGCVVGEVCLSEEFENKSSYCEEGNYKIKNGYDGNCSVDKDCLEGVCKKDICSKKSWLSMFLDWLFG